MKAKLVVVLGDGVGREVIPQGIKVLKAVERRFNHQFEMVNVEMGFATWKATGNALPEETLKACKNSQGILMGPFGGSQDDYAKYTHIPPGSGRWQLNRELGHCVSVRPVRVYPQLENGNPVKASYIHGTDMVVVRDSTWHIKPEATASTIRQTPHGRSASDRIFFYEDEILPIIRFSFLLARTRRKKLVFMTQSSLFQTSKLWQKLIMEMSVKFPDVSVSSMAPDNCTAQVVKDPRQFDVILSENTSMAGMINDLAALLMGSVGMAPGAILGLGEGETFMEMVAPNGMYGSIHGSAPLRAGQWIVNPIGTILGAAMLLQYSLGLEKEAQAVEKAVEQVLAKGYRTYDIMETGMKEVGTAELGDRIASSMESGN